MPSSPNKEQQALDKIADEVSQRKTQLLNSDNRFYENEKALRLAQISIAKGAQVDLTEILRERNEILAMHGLTSESIGDK